MTSEGIRTAEERSEHDLMLDGVRRMQECGGSFVRAIAEAWHHADPINRKKLEDTFPYFKEYKLQVERGEQ